MGEAWLEDRVVLGQMKITSCTDLSFLIYKMGVLMLSIKSGLRITILVCGKALHGYEIPEKRTMFILVFIL